MRRTLGGAIGALLAGSTRELHAASGPLAETWLDELATKKHKIFLDIGVFGTDLGAFRRARALSRALQDSYGAREGDIGIAFGAHGSGLGYLLSAASFDKLGLVDLMSGSLRTADAQALKNATRNWGSLCAENVAELRQHGVKFLACRNTIGRWADRIAAQRKSAAPAVVEEIIAGLHPGVEPVPAMIAAAVLAQERQLSYLAIT